MKKILFTDLDGTLLKDDKTISKKNKAAIQRMLDAGHCLVIATGRAVISGYAIAKSLGLTGPGCYMIAYNGAVVYDCYRECVLTERTMPMEYVKYLFAEAEKYGIHIQTYAEEYVLTQYDNEEVRQYSSANNTPYRVCENVIGELTKAPYKLLLISLTEKERLMQFQREHKEWENGKCNSFFSCDKYLEYCPKDTDKGSGIRALCSYLQVELDNTYAVGDERNDISMLKAAGMGIAMKNGTMETKMAADYITENDNEHDAIAEIIDKFILK